MRKVEPLTLALFVGVYGAWLFATAFWQQLPLPLLLAAGAWLMAWHGSLQHEAIHGHPTGRRKIDTLIAGWPLALWLPYTLYRESHLKHHRSDLTDPVDDPESFYLEASRFARSPRPVRALHWFCQTLLGRLTVGPLIAMVTFARTEARLLLDGDRRRLRIWMTHALWSLPVLAWLLFVAKIPLLTYFFTFAYPGFALTLLRSYVEHRPDGVKKERSAILEAEWPLALLFLNNNLHAIHHDEPNLPWYRIPQRYRERREQVLAENGRYFFRGYREVFARFLLKPKDAPFHPRLDGRTR